MKYFQPWNRSFRCASVTSSYYNPLHAEVIGSECYPAYFEVGQRGWFLYVDEETGGVHRLHTSTVMETRFEVLGPDEIGDAADAIWRREGECYRFTVKTANTEYIFLAPRREGDPE